MSAQQLQMPGNVIGQRSGRRIAVAASIVAALFAGGLVGRSTATTSSSLGDRPATTLSSLGASSVGDARRVEMFAAMNELGTSAIDSLEPTDVSPGSARAEMFRAMNRLQHQRI
jgi:hypothetical protein